MFVDKEYHQIPSGISLPISQIQIFTLYITLFPESNEWRSWFRRLKSALGLPANRLVYCPGGSVERLLKSDIRYDLFLFDLDLLNESGLELCRMVRSLAHRRHIPIIIVASEEVIGRLKGLVRSAGADECVTKTSDPSAAIGTIQRLLGERPPDGVAIA